LELVAYSGILIISGRNALIAEIRHTYSAVRLSRLCGVRSQVRIMARLVAAVVGCMVRAALQIGCILCVLVIRCLELVAVWVLGNGAGILGLHVSDRLILRFISAVLGCYITSVAEIVLK